MRTILAAGIAGLPQLYRTGAFTPTAVVDTYYRRIAARDPALGAYVALLEADARQDAAASSARWAANRPLSALDGAPIAIKANIAVAGAPWHAGIRAFADRIAPQDAACVAALRRQGAIILGLLAMDEGALGGTGDNPWLGRTHNPWRLGFSPGGSSSGAGAAVAAGLCAAALGTDTMGSVRLPAAFCGCVGYKPSRDVISRDGVVPLANSLDHVGVLARSVEDCALVAAGAADGLDPDKGKLGAIDLGIIANLDGVPIDPETQSAIATLTDRAAASGARIVPLDFAAYDFSRVRKNCLLAIEVEAMGEYPWLATETAGFSDGFVQMLRYGASQPPAKITQAYDTIAQAAGFIRDRLAGVTAMILPMTPGPAYRFGDVPPASLGDFAAPANITGAAAVAIPIGVSADGLPLSVQCLGVDDATTLAVARWIEALADRIPAPAENTV
jgi:aspartyl-tRNA(Asn)/glutamyl-tRNA(Gln) amidotransferase subunit A